MTLTPWLCARCGFITFTRNSQHSALVKDWNECRHYSDELLQEVSGFTSVRSEHLHPLHSRWFALLETGRGRRMINVPPPAPHCKLESLGRNYFSWWAARLWLKNGANTVYHPPDDSPPRGKLTTRPYRLARAGSQCPFTLINLPLFLVQLYQSNLSEDTQHWSVNTVLLGPKHTHTHTERERWSGSSPHVRIHQRKDPVLLGMMNSI